MQLQKGPQGILGWFALKVGGRNPPTFGDAVLPVVEVGDNYLGTSELQIQRVALASALAASNNQDFTVPAGKCWRLIGGSFFGSLNVADVALSSLISIGVKSPTSTVFSVLLSVSPKDPGGAIARGWAASFRPPIFLPSGWTVSLALTTSGAITVTSNYQVGVLYQEMDL
jgi:hypothetical protein